MIRLLLATLCWLLCASGAVAHELRPAYLQIDEDGRGSVRVVWKQPAQGNVALRLKPRLSTEWLDGDPAEEHAGGGYRVRTWVVPSAGQGLSGARLEIEGLRESLTDVMVRLRRPGAEDFVAVVRGAEPALSFPETAASTSLGFFEHGVVHILTGVDHLLFVLGLLLLVAGRGQLLVTITAFTLAHSITLAMATLGHLPLNVPLVETLVSLSILMLAIELVRRWRGEVGLTTRRPWIVAFCFGLLHGCAFAGGLAPLELDTAQQALALLLFNLGVEAGQVAFVALVRLISYVMRRFHARLTVRWRALPAYAIGGLGAFWTLQNAVALFAAH